MKYITTESAAAPLGDYAQAVVHEGLVYLSMQLPIGADNDMSGLQSVEEQAQLVLDNIRHILEAAGSSIDKTLRVTVYLKDIHAARRVNGVFYHVFDKHTPARSLVEVSALPEGFSVAMDAVAAL